MPKNKGGYSRAARHSGSGRLGPKIARKSSTRETTEESGNIVVVRMCDFVSRLAVLWLAGAVLCSPCLA
ncbi:hypothetical protein E2C01_034685 [Portunus trituberculatus]|uniref:Uncharacterized protein n=1 Tax=Portunus trituberculatus TaxID=210409 RepID=A0A5B7F265_PORTR|nr:hypothetical protein [Portunus trituberculatus]